MEGMVPRRHGGFGVVALVGLFVVAVTLVDIPAAAASSPSKSEPVDGSEAPLLESDPMPESEAPDWSVAEGETQSASQPQQLRAAPERRQELVDRRNATTRVFENTDGSLSVDEYSVPVHYPTASGWVPIDNSVKADPGRSGWVTTAGNEWKAAFGPGADVELATTAGGLAAVPVGGKTVAPEPVAPPQTRAPPGAAKPIDEEAPALKPGVVRYRGVWPGVDVEYRVRSTGVKEEIVLENAARGGTFEFDVAGARLALDGDSGVRLIGPVGERFGIPAPTVRSADGRDVSVESAIRYEVRARADGTPDGRLAVVLDPAWLAAQAPGVFPLVVDPAFSSLSPSGYVNYPSYPTAAQIQVGRDTSGVLWRGAVQFGSYQSFLSGGYRVDWADLKTQQYQDTGSLTTATDVYIHDLSGMPANFNEVISGPQVASGTDQPTPGYPLAAFNVQPTLDRWVTGGLTNRWFGLRGWEPPSGRTDKQYFVALSYAVYQPTPATALTAPTNSSNVAVVGTLTPTLSAAPVTHPEGLPPRYDFQITIAASPGTGQVIESGWLNDPTWQVPVGALQDGVTYYGWVLTKPGNTINIPPTLPDPGIKRPFKVRLGPGDGGTSPTDEVGSVPGGAASPSEGAPSASLPGSKLTVNMVNGNLSLSMGTTTMGTLSGGAALGFTYNSLAVSNNGLRGEFFNDTNSNSAIDTGDLKVGERIDPTVSFDWGTGGAVTGQDPTKALARWTGSLALPADGTWKLGAVSSDGVRITYDGTVVYDGWTPHDPEQWPTFGTQFTATAGQKKPITIEWHKNRAGPAVVKLYAKLWSDPNRPSYPVPPNWLTVAPKTLPHGWTFNAAGGGARWVGLQDRGTSVIAYSAEGAGYDFRPTGNGSYAAPSDAPGELLAPAPDGGFVMQSGSGQTYTFRPDGNLESITTAGDDLHPAELRYTYSGSPPLLRTITDPVSSRAITLSYGGDAQCSGTPAAAANLLCKIAYWNGADTTLTYDDSGRLVRITNPGPVVHDFAYNNSAMLIKVRDPVANEAIAAGVRPDTDASLTRIYYFDGRVDHITPPEPTPGAPRPQRTYSYDDVARTAQVSVGGFTPATGFAKRVTYDTANRITSTTDAAGLTASYAWDLADRPIATTDPAGLRTTTRYDYAGRVAARYGPAPVGWFQSLPGVDPVAGADVPGSFTTFDEIRGVAAAYWTSPGFAGKPALRDTGIGGSVDLSHDWGTSPPVTPGPGGWSARFTGWVDIPPATDYQGWLLRTKAGRVKVWIDDTLLIDHNQPEPATGWATSTGSGMPSGMHRLRIDMTDTGGPAGIELQWQYPGPGYGVITGFALNPGYGLPTSTLDPDGKSSIKEYSDPAAGIGPHHGLLTATVTDPGGAALREKTTYETPGPGTFLRRTARTLPAGNTWTYEHYGGTDGPLAATCGVAAGTPQGGKPRRAIGPDPDGAGPVLPRVEEFIYDTIDRQVGKRVGDTTTIGSAGWACTTYDTKGRMTSQSWPAHNGAPARTVTYSYVIGGNPLVNSVSDTDWPNASISVTQDLLGRPISYTDIWGDTTTTTYDQAGRATNTAGPLGATAQAYDPATGRPGAITVDGVTRATPTYTAATGRLESVAYANTTTTALGYDTLGRPSRMTTTAPAGTVTDEGVTRSRASRVIDQQVYTPTGLVDSTPGASQNSYVYDGAGRLTTAALPGTTYTYGYATGSACPAPDAAKNVNRATLAVTTPGGTTNTSYCYDGADRLISASDIPSSQVAYDDRGNTTTLGGETFEFDAAGRHTRTDGLSTVSRYRRDPLDRVAEQTDYARITYIANTTATSSGPALTLDRPPGTQPGDLIIAALTVKDAGTLTAPGWTTAVSNTQGSQRTYALWRTATTNDPANWTLTSSGATRLTGALVSYRGPDASSPVGVTATNTQGTPTTSHALPQVSPAGDARQIIHIAGFANNVTPTVPTQTSQRAVLSAAASVVVADRYLPKPGTTSALNITTNTATTSTALTLAVVPKTQAVRYGHSGHGDTSSHVKDTNGTTIERRLGLPGGTTLTLTASAEIWSHGNLHGDTIATTDAAGTRTWLGWTGPYGEPASGSQPDNAGLGTYAWLGQQARRTDGNIAHLGARPYHYALGRFLAVDPVEGGCASDYAYAAGDPVNASDKDGLFPLPDPPNPFDWCIGGIGPGCERDWPKCQRHHIVAQNARSHDDARAVLFALSISIDNPNNTIYLPVSHHHGGRGHEKWQMERINDAVVAAGPRGRGAVLGVLKGIRNDLFAESGWMCKQNYG
jgi:RHS repeat-associated protein